MVPCLVSPSAAGEHHYSQVAQEKTGSSVYSFGPNGPFPSWHSCDLPGGTGDTVADLMQP